MQAVTRRGDVQRGPLRASLRRRGRLAEAWRALALARDREAGGRTAAARSLTEIIVAEIPAFKPEWTFREERLARAPAPDRGDFVEGAPVGRGGRVRSVDLGESARRETTGTRAQTVSRMIHVQNAPVGGRTSMQG